MNEQIAKLRNWFAGLNKREQWLIGITAAVAVYVIWDTFLYAPRAAKNDANKVQIESLNQRISGLEAGLVPLRAALSQDPDKETKDRIQSLQEKIAQTIEAIRNSSDELVSPQQMARALEDVLRKNTELSLVRVQSLETIPLYDEDENPSDEKASNKDEKPVPLAFRHPMEIEFRGNYQQVVTYLQALEELSWHFFWEDVFVQTEEYPEMVIRLKVNTLSLEDTWIGG